MMDWHFGVGSLVLVLIFGMLCFGASECGRRNHEFKMSCIASGGSVIESGSATFCISSGKAMQVQ